MFYVHTLDCLTNVCNILKYGRENAYIDKIKDTSIECVNEVLSITLSLPVHVSGKLKSAQNHAQVSGND